MIFDDINTPLHIDRVNNEARGLFSWLRTDKSTMETAFNTAFKHIDIDLAWTVFDELTYTEIFKETSGDPELLYDPMARKRIMTRVMDRWPVIYYLRLLRRDGIMDSIETVSGEIFFIKETYKPSVNTIFTPSETLSGA